jgi:signal transduction histidine kinase
MEKKDNLKKKEIGETSYLNKNCWLVENLGYAPVERCQYCETRFKECLFFQHLLVSLALIVFLLSLSWLIDGEVSILIIVTIFILIVVYGFFFSRSTEKIIKVNFSEKKAQEALDELNRELETRVNRRTKELNKAYQELQVLDRAKTEFISIASHQLRTPLGVLRGYLSMLLQGDFGSFSSPAREAIGEAYQASLRLLKLSNDLLSASQIDSGKIELSYQKIRIKSFLNEIFSEMKSIADQRGLSLRLKHGKGVIEIEGDVGKLRQVIINLIDNAIRYTEKGGVEIKSSLTENKLLLEISDTGLGLDKKDMNDLFRSFFRGETGKNLNAAGTGLGLYIAQIFVKKHKGRLWAESDGRGKGSRFFIELPLMKRGSSVRD